MKIIFDLETNGLLEHEDPKWVATKVHCGVFIDADTNEPMMSPHPSCDADIRLALEWLDGATMLIGHNILGFDLPILKKFYDWEPDESVQIFDTQIMSRAIWPHMGVMDKALERIPTNLYGKHSLESWGHRLGDYKGDYGKQENAWETFTPEMLEYCEQDVQVTRKLYEKIISKNPSEHMIRIERDFSKVLLQQHNDGFPFDIRAAREFESDLRAQKFEMDDELLTLFPPELIEWETPKRKEKRSKLVPFNPNSGDQIARNLVKKYGWKPNKRYGYTETGKIKVDDKVLSKLRFPEAKKILERRVIVKKLGLLADGKKALIKYCGDDERIHASAFSTGAPTGRCAHFNPALNWPKVGEPYGEQFRSLMRARKGHKMIGSDASQAQLRCLAHELIPYDGGAYTANFEDGGDVHTVNQLAAGLKTRDAAKTFVYKWLFGAFDKALGEMVGGGAKEGAKLRSSFEAKVVGLKEFMAALKEEWKENNGYISCLDGRMIPVSDERLLLVYRMQGDEQALMKQATIDLHATLKSRGLTVGVDEDYCQVAHVYDEIQLEVKEEFVNEVSNAAVESIRNSGAPFGFRCRMDADAKVGDTWAETH